MGIMKNFIDGVANAKLIPVALSVSNIDRPVTVRVYRKDKDGGQTAIGTYVGKLEAFWSDEESIVIQLKGLDTIRTTWADHRVSVDCA